MSSQHDDEDIHYSEKAGTAEQQKHAARTYTYKSCRPHDADDESYMNFKISIQVRNISFHEIRASLVKELIGDIYDRDKAHWKANLNERKPFNHNDTGRTIKWTVDQRNNIAQLYAYDVGRRREGRRREGRRREGRHGERHGDRDHPQGIWMQYNTLLGSGYVFNTTSNPNAREDILNQARELFVHRRPHPKTIEGDWTYVKEENGKYRLDERKHLGSWPKTKFDISWLASASTETIKSGVTSPYEFGEYELQVLNDCKVELDVATLDNLFLDYFSNDPHAKKWAYWRTTGERNRNGRNNFFISKYHPSGLKMPYHMSSNKKVWITNHTTGQSYQTVRNRLETTSKFNATAQNESHWKLDRKQGNDRLILEEISNGASREKERSRSRSRSHYEGAESVYYPCDESLRGRRPESHSTHRRSPSVSSRGGSNQERATDDRRMSREYRPRSNRNLPDYILSREQYRAATSDSSSGVDSYVVGQDISFYNPRTAGSGSSTTSKRRHTQIQTEEPKERGRNPRNIREMAKYLSPEQRQERTRERNLRREKKWQEEQLEKQKRKEEKLAKKRRKDEEREEEKWERERRKESRQRRNRGDHSDWEGNYERGERARKPSAHRKLTFEVSYRGRG
ncbi:hypothetical protein BCON_0062g00170 [Botryotinia convoluta]|uniref:Uncharacterized protein n=1 Tax=Botryotinia convoluta TaxID=54673 RepID=A0A4Z1IM23_9HELO|nr:hypothetical protein BCON_0062g00170 [Botryotinia convoluta]